jgi:hypothetical protein
VILIWGIIQVRRAKEVAKAQENCKKVTKALIDYAEQDPDHYMPTQAIYDKKSGQPLLSWRVAILPQLGEQALYEQIHLDEPWDSPHNQQFWERMPKAYALPGLPASGGLTAIQVFTGPETPFEEHRAIRLPAGFTDGPDVTILVAEAATAVNWMRPEDLDMNKLDLDDIGASLADRTGKGPMVGLADGSVRPIINVHNVILKALITPSSGDITGGEH